MSGSQVKKCVLFYKLISLSILQQKKLRIPKNFVKKFGDELSGFATLTVPDDRLWLVTLREIDQKLWFCNGWHEFVEHYSICFGHFLVFQYEGNSNFTVYMYVLQPYKINDLCTAATTVKNEHHNVLDEVEDDDSVEILGYTPTCVASNPLKHNIFNECVEQNTTYKIYNPPSPQNFFNRDKFKDCMNGLGEASQNPSGGSVKSTLPLQSTQGIGVKRNELQDSEDDMRLQFLDKVRQNIEKTMQKKQRIDEENLRHSGAADISLRSTRSSQDVGVQSNSMDHKNSADDGTQKFSYKAAAEHLGKVEGKNKKIDRSEQQRATLGKIKAEASRVFKTAGVRKRSLTTEERKMAINAANAFKPVNPFCRVVLRPSYLFKGCAIYLPSCFAKKHLNEVSGKIKLQFSDGKQWPVRCAYREGTARLCQGWYEFSAEHGFEEGDVCVFELLNSKDIVLKVTVFRTAEDSGCMNQH